MKKWILPIVIIALLALLGMNRYNSTIGLEENVNESWAKVESAYQRRADLIPNLVATVKGYAAHEKETLEGVIKARSEATKTTINAGELTPEKMAQFEKAQQGLSGALSRLLLTVERYPDLKANKNFSELQSQIEGAENRINVVRDRFNSTVKPYNNHIRSFPNNLFASMFGFEKKAYFEAESESKKAPKIEF